LGRPESIESYVVEWDGQQPVRFEILASLTRIAYIFAAFSYGCGTEESWWRHIEKALSVSGPWRAFAMEFFGRE